MHALGGVLVVVMTVAAGTTSESCLLGTKTNFCEQFGLICKPGQECAANQAVCIEIGGCGDGIRETSEVCDDGNILDGETDDSGVFVPDGCSHDCKSRQVCGNGIVDRGESCDHGSENGSPTSSCNIQCQLVSKVCGNGVVDPDTGEQCDPGTTDSVGCNSNRAGSASCKAARCGDGYVNLASGENCDSMGLDTPGCNSSLCTLPACGDHYVNSAAGEECESAGVAGVDTSTCNGNHAGSASCRLRRCGDGYINAVAGEECENNSDCASPKVCSSCKCM